MEATLLALALLGSPAVIPVSDRVPQFNVEALCQQTTAVDKTMGLAEPQSLANCMRDEKDAQQQLVTLWSTNPSGVRDRCEGEAVAAGAPSYVDLLTCLQMTDLVNSQSTGAPLKGGSKNRNKK
jgi:hypothetical protein